MINYPNGKKFILKTNNISKDKKLNLKASFSAANRGMNLEENINISNEYYLNEKIALITKRPTPINVIKVDYKHGKKIVDAYFEKQSTTDYNGIYNKKYLDFEAKSTKSRTSLPLANIEKHQIEHLKRVVYFGGIAFFIIQFETLNEVYFLDAKYVINFYENSIRKSIPYTEIKNNGLLIKQGICPRLYYIDAVNTFYFN